MGSTYTDTVQLDLRILAEDADRLVRVLTEASRGQALITATKPFDAAF